MKDEIKTDEAENLSGKTWFRGFLWLSTAVLLLYVSGVMCLAAAHFVQFGINEKSVKDISEFLLFLKQDPLFIVSAYGQWADVFSLAFKYRQLNAASFIPLISPLLFAGVTIWAFVKSPVSFKLWYKLNNHFARAEDVEKMGLFSGTIGALGRFQNRILRLGRPLSLFGWGSPGLGKTSTVAIPSILESDNSCIAAVDCKGSLVKYTSGYRARLGKVYYFNWNMSDKPQAGQFWPRWNPFSDCNLPPKGLDRDRYLSVISKYILSLQDDNYWGKLASIALEGLMQFYVSKIEQAYANDYFLSEILDNGRLNAEDKDVLLSYYASMPEDYSKPAIENLENNTLTIENYLPIGSWQNIPPQWQGKEFCFAMMVDCLIERFYTVRQEEEGREYGRWKAMLGNFVKESEFFGYHPRANQVMQHLYYLTKKQRKTIFAMMLEPLMVFRKNSVRERTSSSDLALRDIRGKRDALTGVWQVCTVYTVADNRPAAFMTRFFMDMLIKTNLELYQHKSPFPLLFVFDDFEIMPKFNMLEQGLIHGPQARMSFLLLTDNIKNIQDHYGSEGLEEIITNTSYKLMFAYNNKSLSEHFTHLSAFGTKSVQIPATDTGAFFKVKQGLADASYYRRIAGDLLDKRRQGIVRKGQHLLLVQGYYHLPVRIESLYFLRDEKLKAKSLIDAAYFLDAESIEARDVQDAEVPVLLAVLQEAGVQVEREEEVDAYLNDQIDTVAEGAKREAQDKKSALAEDISSRWSKDGSPQASSEAQNDEDWWMSEDSFSLSRDIDQNPFEKH